MGLTIDPRRIRNLLLAVVAFFVVTTVIDSLLIDVRPDSTLVDVLRPLDATLELSLPTWFASVLLLACAAMLALIGRQDERWRRHWLGLSAVFAALSIDEAAALHERVTEPLRDLLGTGGFLYLAWVVPAAAGLVVLGLTFRRWAAELEPGTRRRIFLALALFLTGAFGLELVGGEIADLYGEYGLGQSLVATAEEALEMTGLVLFTHALLIELGARVGEVSVEVQETATEAPRPARVLPSGAVSSPHPADQR